MAKPHSGKNSLLKHAFGRVCVKRSIIVALIVGTILALINHYDAILNNSLTTTNVFQILLTYFVPYAVASYGSAMNERNSELSRMNKKV